MPRLVSSFYTVLTSWSLLTKESMPKHCFHKTDELR